MKYYKMNRNLFLMKGLKSNYYDESNYEQYVSMIEYCRVHKRVKFYFGFVIYDRHYLTSYFHKYMEDFDRTMKNIYKQTKENKNIFNRVKIFSKKRKLCNDIRNIIISFLITPPKIYSLQIY